MCLYASVLDVGRCAEDGFGLLLYWNAGCCETDLCMLRYWIWDAVPRMVSVCCFTGMRDVVRPICVCFGIGYGTLCRSGSCMLRCWLRSVVPIFSYILCFFWHWAGCTFASILCSLRLNFQPGMWQRYGLLRRRCDTA